MQCLKLTGNYCAIRGGLKKKKKTERMNTRKLDPKLQEALQGFVLSQICILNRIRTC